MAAPKKYGDELRERATRMAVELRKDPATRAGTIQRVGEQLGIQPGVSARVGEASGIGFVGSLPPIDHPRLLAIGKTRYTVVDSDRFPELTCVDTTVTALGVTRRAVLTHSPTLHAAQSRGFDQTLAKARRRLTELQTLLARGKPAATGPPSTRDRHDLPAPPGQGGDHHGADWRGSRRVPAVLAHRPECPTSPGKPGVGSWAGRAAVRTRGAAVQCTAACRPTNS